MAADIKLELESFDNETRNLDAARIDMDENKEKITKSLDDLAAVWSGSAGTVYAGTVNCIKAGLIEYSRGLDQMIDNLLQARQAVVDADAAGAQ